MRIAVLLSTFNGEKYLTTQLDSIINQTCSESISIIVRDDGSTDGTVEILEKYAKEGKLTWSCGESLGPARSFLTLMKENPEYDYYAFADQDDYWEKYKIEIGLRYIAGIDKPAIFFSNGYLVDSELNSLGRNVRKTIPRINLMTILCSGGTHGCTMLFNRKMNDLISKAGIPESVRMHDQYVPSVCLMFGGEIVYKDVCLIKYRQHQMNVVGISSTYFDKIKQRINMIFKKPKYSISDNAYALLSQYKNSISEGDKSKLEMIAYYKTNSVNRFRLACSREIRYGSISLEVANRLGILLKNR